jgi:hypothetical protein
MNTLTNPSFYTSFLFIVPTYMGFALNIEDIILTCAACALTSIANHAYGGKNKTLNLLDKVVVNSIGVGYVVHCVYEHMRAPVIEYTLTIWFGLLTMYMYLYIRTCLGYGYHPIVHLLAIAGIMIYIRGRACTRTLM